MELQNQRKAPSPKARPSGKKAASRGFRLGLPADFDKNVRLILAALLFLGSTWWALTRYSRPYPFRRPEFLSLSWFIHPLEANAPARLPVVSGTLTSLAVSGNGKELLVAGQEGTVLRYRTSNQEWENLSVPDSLGKGPAWVGPRSRDPIPRVRTRKPDEGSGRVLDGGAGTGDRIGGESGSGVGVGVGGLTPESNPPYAPVMKK